MSGSHGPGSNRHSSLFYFSSFSTFRNILAPLLPRINRYSARERTAFDEPRSRSNQCFEPEANQLGCLTIARCVRQPRAEIKSTLVTFLHSLLFQSFATFLHHFQRESIDIVLENELHSMSRDPGLINELRLKQINSVV